MIALPSVADLTQIAQLLKDAQASVSLHPLAANQSSPVLAAQTHTASANAAEANHETREVTSPAAALQKSSDAAAGKTYILFEGSIFESVLINRLYGALTSSVTPVCATRSTTTTFGSSAPRSRSAPLVLSHKQELAAS